MAPTNKMVKVDEFSMNDSLSHVQVVEGDVPEPKQGEVLVNVYMRPVNPTDVILIKTGWGGAVPLPSNPGSDGQLHEAQPPLAGCSYMVTEFFALIVGVGKVVKNGPGASQYKEGQRVSAAPWPQFQGKGSWAQYVCVPEKDLVCVFDIAQMPDLLLLLCEALMVCCCCRCLYQTA